MFVGGIPEFISSFYFKNYNPVHPALVNIFKKTSLQMFTQHHAEHRGFARVFLCFICNMNSCVVWMGGQQQLVVLSAGSDKKNHFIVNGLMYFGYSAAFQQGRKLPYNCSCKYTVK